MGPTITPEQRAPDEANGSVPRLSPAALLAAKVQTIDEAVQVVKHEVKRADLFEKLRNSGVLAQIDLPNSQGGGTIPGHASNIFNPDQFKNIDLRDVDASQIQFVDANGKSEPLAKFVLGLSDEKAKQLFQGTVYDENTQFSSDPNENTEVHDFLKTISSNYSGSSSLTEIKALVEPASARCAALLSAGAAPGAAAAPSGAALPTSPVAPVATGAMQIMAAPGSNTEASNPTSAATQGGSNPASTGTQPTGTSAAATVQSSVIGDPEVAGAITGSGTSSGSFKKIMDSLESHGNEREQVQWFIDQRTAKERLGVIKSLADVVIDPHSSEQERKKAENKAVALVKGWLLDARNTVVADVFSVRAPSNVSTNPASAGSGAIAGSSAAPTSAAASGSTLPPAPGAGPTTYTRETGALGGALQRFHTTPEAIQAISIAKMLENGPVTHLPSIGRPEPTTSTEWAQKRGEFCKALVQEFASKQVCVDGGWVEPVVMGLEELARLPKEAQSADASEHVDRAHRLIEYLKERKIAGLGGNGSNREDEGDDAVKVLTAIGYWGPDANVTYLRARPCADFSQEVMDEVARVQEARQAGIQRREGVVDLTGLPTFTIDPEGSQDHDDAFSVETLNPEESAGATHRIHLHVTNVAEAIGSFEALMQEAYRRGSTIYRPTGNHIPMLPTELSHDLLSLNEGEDREAVTISFDVKGDGSLVGEPQLKRSIINVNKNLTFADADRLLAQEAGDEEDAEMRTALQAAQRFAGRFRQSLEQTGVKRINFDSSVITNDDGSWEIKTTPQGAGRAMIESLSHAYSCTAAELFEQKNEGREMKALFRRATLKDEPHAQKNRERFEGLAEKSGPSEKDIAEMRVLQMGLMEPATLELSPAAVPHEGIGKPSMASSSPLRDATNLYNQRVLLALTDPRVEPPLADSIVTLVWATSFVNRGVHGDDTNRAIWEMIRRGGDFKAYAVSAFVSNRSDVDKPRKQLRLFIPELNRWFPVPQDFRDKAHTAGRTSQTISVTLAESGDRIGVTAVK